MSYFFFKILFFILPLLFIENIYSQPVLQGEYKLNPIKDPDILGDRETELWAQVYYPSSLPQPAPLVVFLHGNHGTCGKGSYPRNDNNCAYTTTGICPQGYSVTPNHLGYGYLAEKLSQEGFIVVSINANRGITCGNGVSGDFGLNLARGKLVLSHLKILSQWNLKGQSPSSIGIDLQNKIDFSKVGFMGHSRGGEGVRAAYNLYSDPESLWPKKILAPLNIRAIFEIGPVDGQTDRVLDAFNTAWNVLLPLCDGDVSSLEGIRSFDRMLLKNRETRGSSKSATAIWGTNHNFYNTEWHESDSYSCKNHKPLWLEASGLSLQKETAELTLIPFFKEKLMGNSQSSREFLSVFDPSQPLPKKILDVTRIDRSYVPTVDRQWTSILDLNSLEKIEFQKVKVDRRVSSTHDQTLSLVSFSWKEANEETFVDIPLTDSSLSQKTLNLLSIESILFRLNRPYWDRQPLSVDFSLSLRDQSGAQSTPILLSQFIDLTLPAGKGPLLTVKILSHHFKGHFDRSQVTKLRITFNKTSEGSILFSQPQLMKWNFIEELNSVLPLTQNMNVFKYAKMNQTTHDGSLNLIESKIEKIKSKKVKPMKIRFYPSLSSSIINNPVDQIEIQIPEGFTVRNALPTLQIGSKIYKSGRFPQNGSLNKMIFDIPRSSPSDFNKEDSISFFYEGSSDEIIYDGGTLDQPNQ